MNRSVRKKSWKLTSVKRAGAVLGEGDIDHRHHRHDEEDQEKERDGEGRAQSGRACRRPSRAVQSAAARPDSWSRQRATAAAGMPPAQMRRIAAPQPASTSAIAPPSPRSASCSALVGLRFLGLAFGVVARLAKRGPLLFELGLARALLLAAGEGGADFRLDAPAPRVTGMAAIRSRASSASSAWPWRCPSCASAASASWIAFVAAFSAFELEGDRAGRTACRPTPCASSDTSDVELHLRRSAGP